MLSVCNSEVGAPTVFFQNLKSAAAYYYRQYNTGPSEHCAVAVWPGAGIRLRESSGVLLLVW